MAADPFYETLVLGPPFKGIGRPTLDFYNPAAEAGRFLAMDEWMLYNHGEYLHIHDLWGAVAGTSVGAGQVRMITNYKSASRNDLIVVAGNTLQAIDLDGASSTDIATLSGAGAAATCRVTWVRFRNRFLIALMADSTPATLGGLWWYDPENRTARKAGVPAPTGAPTGAAGVAGTPNGTYKLYYSYVNDQGHESNLSPVGSVTVANQHISWTNITVGPTGTTARKLYRSTTGQTTGLFLTTINDNSTTTYDDNNADSVLGSPNEANYTVPPNGIRNIAVLGNRVYLVSDDGLTMFACKTDASTSLPNWEAYPFSLQYSFVGGSDSFKAITPIGQALFAWGGLSGFRTLGDIAVGNSATETLPWGLGLFSPSAWCITPKGLLFIDQSRKLRLFDGSSAPKEVGPQCQLYLDSISVSATGIEGPLLSYWDHQNLVVISLSNPAFPDLGAQTLFFDLDTEEFSTMRYSLDPVWYNQNDRKLYAYHKKTSGPDNNIWQLYPGLPAAGITNPGFTVPAPKLDTMPIQPLPGEEVYFLRFIMIVKAQPMGGSGIVPLFKIEYTINDNSFMEYKYVDISSDFIYLSDPLQSNSLSPLRRTIELPIYRMARSFRIRITPVYTSTFASGGEIYYMAIHWKPRAESKLNRLNVFDGGHISTAIRT